LFFTQQGKDVIHQLAQSTVPTHKQKEKKCKTAKQTKAPFDSQEDLEQSSRISSQPSHQHNLEVDFRVTYVTLQINVRTYEDLLPLVCSCMSSPLGLTVKILQSGTPTSL